CAFFPQKASGDPDLSFILAEVKKKVSLQPITPNSSPQTPAPPETHPSSPEIKLNPFYTFPNFIEGPTNQFVKSAAMGVSSRPSNSYNPLFIHGGVGLGKTHLLHAIGHHVREHHKKLRIHCITTEGFINDLVDNLRNKSLDRMKRFYRTLDLLLVDDIQF